MRYKPGMNYVVRPKRYSPKLEEPCRHPNHTIDVSMVGLRPGQVFVHRCPKCGHETCIEMPKVEMESKK